MTLGIVGNDGSIQKSTAPDVLTFPEMYEKVNGKKLDGADLEAFIP